MNKSIIFYDSATKLINPMDEVFENLNLVEINMINENNTDENLTSIILDNLNINEYVNILIPACFGNVLSDFLGLRLATHIRCTSSINQFSNIFIYSFTSINDFFSSENFNILKTEGVFLIDYSIEGIIEKVNYETKILTKTILDKEVRKLNLPIPLDHDNHSVSNEWAIYKWAKTIDAKDEAIKKIESSFQSNLYLKYLQTIYPVNITDMMEGSDLKINFEGNATVLYIDDEADKGWKEIFETIFYDKNSNIGFLHLDSELNGKTKEEIVDLSLEKIKEENVDTVILDFRLHPDDINCKSIKEVTGYQVLKKIKDHNQGIQVIIFSATNKIWNLQALLDARADGFIMKEGPENSFDSKFTKHSINNLIETIHKCLNRAFLKDFYHKLEILKDDLIPRKNFKKSNRPLPKEFVDETLKWYELSLNFFNAGLTEEQLISVFLVYFTIIENISNRVIEIENPIKEGDFYKFQFRKNLQRLNNYIEDSNNPGFYRKTGSKYKSPKRSLRWDIKIYNTIDFISDNNLSIESINDLVKKRNNIIHSNSTLGDVIEVKKDDVLLLNKIIYEGLLNVV